jgi:hypothetical protein
MFVSIGWYCLLGGLWGAIGTAATKKFHRSDFANSEGIITKDDFKVEVPMTPRKRWIIVGICTIIALAGILKIQSDHNWNPFSGVASQISAAR